MSTSLLYHALRMRGNECHDTQYSRGAVTIPVGSRPVESMCKTRFVGHQRAVGMRDRSCLRGDAVLCATQFDGGCRLPNQSFGRTRRVPGNWNDTQINATIVLIPGGNTVWDRWGYEASRLAVM